MLNAITHNRFTALLEFVRDHPGEQVRGKTRKIKTNLDLLEQEIVSGSGICWAICKSAPHPRQPRQHPTTQFFAGRMPFLPPTNSVKELKAKSKRYYLNLNSVAQFTVPSQRYIMTY